MKMPGGKLKELQKHWYRKLEESGFKDIEKLVNGELVLKQDAPHSFWYMDSFEIKMREEYHWAISYKINDETTTFKNKIDKLILQMHAAGSKIKDIVSSLISNGEKRNRASVRYIIRRYEMEWNIKRYSPKQLNKKSS